MKETVKNTVNETVGEVCCVMEEMAKTVCRKTVSLSKTARISVEIERQKCRLSKIYQKIGEAVVSGSLSSGTGEEQIFKLIDEAKTEKARLFELQRRRSAENRQAACPSCGRPASDKDVYCSHCGAPMEK